MKSKHFTILTVLLFFGPILGAAAQAGNYELTCAEINSGVGHLGGGTYDARVGVGIHGGVGRLTGGPYQFDLGFMSCPVSPRSLIPTVSAWGMLALMVVLLTGLTIKFRGVFLKRA